MPGFPTDALPIAFSYVPDDDRTDADRAAIVRKHFEKREPCVVDRFEVTVEQRAVTRVTIGGRPFLTSLLRFPGYLIVERPAGNSKERRAILRAFGIKDLTPCKGTFRDGSDPFCIASPDWMRPGYLPDFSLLPQQPEP